MRLLSRLLLLVLCLTLPVLLATHWWTSPAGPSRRIAPHVWIALVCLGLVWSWRRLRKPQMGLGPACGIALTLALSLLTTGYLGLMNCVDVGLSRRSAAGKSSGTFADPHKVWAPRGLVPESGDISPTGDQNSIAAVQRAFESGATGVEIDVFFDTDMGLFVVSHDRPYNLKNGELLTLEPMLQAVGKLGYIWLDFKKLRHLDSAALAASVAELERLCAAWIPKNRMYVEGEAPLALASYARAGFPTIFDTHPLPDEHLITPLLVNLYKAVFYLFDFQVMGMNSGGSENSGGSQTMIYGAETKAILHDLPVFLYHVPDEQQLLEELLELPAVRVILIQDQRLNRYGLRPSAG